MRIVFCPSHCGMRPNMDAWCGSPCGRLRSLGRLPLRVADEELDDAAESILHGISEIWKGIWLGKIRNL